MPTAKAGAQSRVPVPSPSPQHGGRRGRWGQARLVGAGEANGGRKPPASCPSPPTPNTREATGPNPESTECRSSYIAGHAQVVAVRNNFENGIPDVPDKSQTSPTLSLTNIESRSALLRREIPVGYVHPTWYN
jgi:hypothetical protein